MKKQIYKVLRFFSDLNTKLITVSKETNINTQVSQIKEILNQEYNLTDQNTIISSLYISIQEERELKIKELEKKIVCLQLAMKALDNLNNKNIL